MQKLFPSVQVQVWTQVRRTYVDTRRLSVFPTSSEKSMADAFFRVREFDDNMEVRELDCVLRHRGYGHLAHPSVPTEDKLPPPTRPPTPARWALSWAERRRTIKKEARAITS